MIILQHLDLYMIVDCTQSGKSGAGTAPKSDEAS